jgi:hypothetical protein
VEFRAAIDIALRNSVATGSRTHAGQCIALRKHAGTGGWR